MFKLDIEVFNFIYNICKSFGNCFMLGAFEGAVLLGGSVTATILTYMNPKKVRR